MEFKKSSYSGDGGCVEVAMDATIIRIRDSKDASGPVLQFTKREWTAFLEGMRDGEFDLT